MTFKNLKKIIADRTRDLEPNNSDDNATAATSDDSKLFVYVFIYKISSYSYGSSC